MHTFVALDVETANSDYSSICAIGLCRFYDGLVVDEWHGLINPDADFFWKNVEIHGIQQRDVAGQPCFSELLPEMEGFVDGDLVVHHGHFDRNAIGQASQRWRLPPPNWGFIDTLIAAKQAWPERRGGGYQLPDLCHDLGHELLHHHNALDDARAAGAVFLAASERLGGERVAALAQRISRPGEQPHLWSEDVDVSLMQDVIVFSKDATELSEDAQLKATLKRRRAHVQKQLSDKTTIYVLSADEWRLGRTSGQRLRAAKRVGRGQRLQIMSETDFLAMIEYS